MRRHSWSFLSFLSSFVGYKFVQYHKIQSGIGIKKLHSALYIDNLHCANDPWLILEQTVRILNTLHYHSHKQNSYYPLKCNNWLLPRKENYTIWISSHFFFCIVRCDCTQSGHYQNLKRKIVHKFFYVSILSQ